MKIDRPIPSQNGRLEVAWRIYEALCRISPIGLTMEQLRLINVERKAAYDRYVAEGDIKRELDTAKNIQKESDHINTHLPPSEKE